MYMTKKVQDRSLALLVRSWDIIRQKARFQLSPWIKVYLVVGKKFLPHIFRPGYT